MDIKGNKKKLNIFVKILIIICLFILSGVGGYSYGMITEKPVKKEVPKPIKEKELKSITNRMNKDFKLQNGLILNIQSLDKYTNIPNLDNAVGLKVEIRNHTKKTLPLPYKHKLNLLFDNKPLTSIGVYDLDLLNNNDIKNVPEKIKPNENLTVVYMYKTDNPEVLNAYKVKLELIDNTDKHTVTIDLDETQFVKKSGSMKKQSNIRVQDQENDYSNNNAGGQGVDNGYASNNAGGQGVRNGYANNNAGVQGVGNGYANNNAGGQGVGNGYASNNAGEQGEANNAGNQMGVANRY